MAGPNLEVFKFGLYLFFPLAVMIHYGDPEWYHRHVLPFRDEFWPKESTLFKPPRTAEGVKNLKEELRQERLARRQARTSENASVIEASKDVRKGSSADDVTKAVSSSSSSIAARQAVVDEWRRVDRSRSV